MYEKTEIDAQIAAHKRVRVWCEGEAGGFTSAWLCKCGEIGRGYCDDDGARGAWAEHVGEVAWCEGEREWFDFEWERGRRFSYFATVHGSEDPGDWHELGFGSLAGSMVAAREIAGVDELQRVRVQVRGLPVDEVFTV